MSEIQENLVVTQFEPQTNAPSLGLLLKKAREVRGLTIGDVVHALKFSSRQIEALEANDMAALPGNVFVRGIVRSYARLLKLDPEPLLALLANEAPVAIPDVRPPDNMGNAMPRGGLRQIPPLVALAVLLLIASASMVGWHYFGPKATLSAKAVDPSVASEPESAAQPSPTQVLPPAPQVRAESVETHLAPVPEAAPVPAADVRQLSFHFHGKSWIEVRDSSQQIILTGQYVDGNREQVSGRPPFQMVIGNAAHVDLEYGDRVVDLKPYTRAEVARLSLD